MKITNKFNLPMALVRAVENDPYNKGECDFSVTELLKPPRVRALSIKHKNDLTEDASDRLWSLYGQIAHSILERSVGKEPGDIVEKRFFAKFDKWTVSAQVDTLSRRKKTLTDWKFTTSWKFRTDHAEIPFDWEAQMNMQLEILRQNNFNAEHLQIVGLLRDHSKLEAMRNSNYPNRSVMQMPIPIWEREKTQRFIVDKIKEHLEAEKVLTECSHDDRWATADKWAVMMKGKKRALKLCDTEAYANLLAREKGGYVEHRPGESKRCENYCPVSNFCDQYKSLTKRS